MNKDLRWSLKGYTPNADGSFSIDQGVMCACFYLGSILKYCGLCSHTGVPPIPWSEVR